MEQRTLKSLLKPSAYPEATTSVRLVQTHVSFIFITDNFVYKIKKPVDFEFLNFTTLDRRRFYCNEEVRLNRRLCPDIYLGVVEVRESSGGAMIDAEGPVIDYAVKMKRLPEERMLDRLLRAGEVSDGDIRRIAGTIAEFHLNAGRSEEIDSYGRVERIRWNWDENFQQIAGFISVTIGNRDLLTIREWVEKFLAEQEGLFASRVSQGFIRECDGDIHTENICLADQVWVFDCIEFNNRFRYSDTAADIAFLLMDFDFHGRPDLSGVFLSEYVAITGDRDICRLLDFYKTYRAVIRGKVESFRLRDPHIPENEKQAARERAIRYFRLARGYVIRQRLPPTLIITCGPMGSGKSTVAAGLSLELGIEAVSSDRVRKELAAVPEYSHDFSAYGTGIYSAAFTEATYGELLARAEQALAGGRSVIIDATFRRRGERDRFRALAGKFSAPFRIIRTTAPEDLLRKRLEQRLTSPREASDGRWELFRKQQEEFEPLGQDEPNQISLDTSLPLHDTINTILHALGIL
ncbi:MAG: AAA family ATPase [Geobacteraceae bacterium]|nr:AAA family ATPase [Geobacteraceae bacterium]